MGQKHVIDARPEWDISALGHFDFSNFSNDLILHKAHPASEAIEIQRACARTVHAKAQHLKVIPVWLPQRAHLYVPMSISNRERLFGIDALLSNESKDLRVLVESATKSELFSLGLSA